LECYSGGTRRCLASASYAHIGQEKQIALESSYRACKGPVGYGPKDMTWEHEDVMRAEYPHIFENFEKLVDVSVKLH
jgi:hypothetical protein